MDFALILPGFLGSCGDFESLAEEMRASGYPAAVCPIEWWHWIPCVGGRSMRPILDRIDHALDQLDGMPRTVKAPEYSLLDFFQDCLDVLDSSLRLSLRPLQKSVRTLCQTLAASSR